MGSDGIKSNYSIIMPPPNITGVLHMGHMLNMTIQDVLIRYNSNSGCYDNVYWIPGLDHAAIATESKVIEYLKKEKNINRDDVSRDEFIKYCWEWKEKYGLTIVEQIKRINCFCDWDKLHFTLDKDVSDLVIDTFIKLFNDGLIYRSNKIINWDCKNKTAISDEEVIFRDIDSVLYHLRYNIVDSDEYLVVATSRPETIFGDVAVFVNPSDDRYRRFVGKKVIIPIVNREVPVIADEYVDKEFGTGCLKVTPAHDFNDYILGEKYKLECINILNDNGTLNEKCGEFVNQDRFEARKNIKLRLKECGLLVDEKRYKTRIGFSERSNTIIEPRISRQWFLSMESLSVQLLDILDKGIINFHPDKFVNSLRSWLENIQDWCLSRQLYWGHRIPVYYYIGNNSDLCGKYVVARDIDEASKKLGCSVDELRQDDDVLDTWFSAALWPIVCTDNLIDLPTNDLVTGPDIIFFWVARMIMFTYYLRGKIPFKNVYFTGIIRDNIGRKMSKSLGNSPDTFALIDKYSSDGVRFGLLLCTQAGNDLKFDEKLCKQGRNFITKIRNAYRLLMIWNEQLDCFKFVSEHSDVCLNKENIDVFEGLMAETEALVNSKIKEYRINEAAMLLYSLFWDEFCSKLLESQKKNLDKSGTVRIFRIFYKLMGLLNPFIPDVTSEIRNSIQSFK